MKRGSRLLREAGFRWIGVEAGEYKPKGSDFFLTTKQILLGLGDRSAGLSFETRYLEIQPGGYSTLEKHAHAHAVVVLRGHGRVILDQEICELSPLDCLYVAPGCIHQFHATGDEALGFLCIVDRNRDRPRSPSPRELDRLRSDTRVAALMKTSTDRRP
ncbi:MAG: cupin domain-containing protein [Candidatus Binatia bacterium]